MTKKVLSIALFVVLAFALVWAGEKKAAPNPQMEQMRAEMMKCAVCKNMADQAVQLMPATKMEVVKLDNGMAMTGTMTNPKQMAAYHALCDKWSEGTAASMQMTDEQAKTGLCQWCQDLRSIRKAGAQMSYGKTKNGDLLVLSSADPAVQAQIAAHHDKCVAQMAEMEKPATPTATTGKK